LGGRIQIEFHDGLLAAGPPGDVHYQFPRLAVNRRLDSHDHDQTLIRLNPLRLFNALTRMTIKPVPIRLGE
jgi:hypothetical protein